MSVTIMANAPYHSMYFGAPFWTPVSIMSKSRTRFTAPMPTTKSRSPSMSKDGNERDDEAGEKAADHPRNGRLRRLGVRQAPCPGGGGHDAEQEQAGLVDGALQRHCFAKSDLALECLFIECRIGSAHQVCHGGILPINEFLIFPYLVLLNSTPRCLSFPLWAAQDEIAQVDFGSPAIWRWTCSLNSKGWAICGKTSGVPPVPLTITVP